MKIATKIRSGNIEWDDRKIPLWGVMGASARLMPPAPPSQAGHNPWHSPSWNRCPA